MKHICVLAAFLSLASTPAAAEFIIKTGTFFKVTGDYDHETNRFASNPPIGEKDACFQITDVRLDQKEIDFTLISGRYAPWWMDGEVLAPGFADTFVPAIGFKENNPSANWTELLSKILTTVPSCPAPAS